MLKLILTPLFGNCIGRASLFFCCVFLLFSNVNSVLLKVNSKDESSKQEQLEKNTFISHCHKPCFSCKKKMDRQNHNLFKKNMVNFFSVPKIPEKKKEKKHLQVLDFVLSSLKKNKKTWKKFHVFVMISRKWCFILLKEKMLNVKNF